MLKRFLITIIVLCQASVGQAKPLLNIVISEGRTGGVPIGVVPFNKDVHVKHDPALEVGHVIRRDLHNSGQFRTLPFNQVPHQSHESPTQYQTSWQDLGIHYVVTGDVQQVGVDTYDIEFRLLDLIQDYRQDPILHQRFTNQSGEQLRYLSHHISDLIFEKIIGIKGVFSTRIAYIAVKKAKGEQYHALTIADADGFNDRVLLLSKYPLMSPAWSPDGQKIAYVSFEGNRSAINIIDVKNGQVEQITKTRGINGAPAWSPNGKELAVVLSKDGAPKLYTVELTGKRIRRLTHGGAIDTEPYWAPDGKSIYFTSNRGGKPQIYQLNFASNKVRRVTYEGAYNATPSITPDGKKLIMMHKTIDGVFSIAVQDLQEGGVTLLTRASMDESPTLAPNGMMVLYSSEEAGRHILGAVSLDGRIKVRLPMLQAEHVKEPAWSPFLS